VRDEKLPQVRLNRRERFRLMRQHHPQGEARDGPRLILHDPPIQKKAPLWRFFRFCGTALNVPDENLPQVRLNRRERFRLMRQHHPHSSHPTLPVPLFSPHPDTFLLKSFSCTPITLLTNCREKMMSSISGILSSAVSGGDSGGGSVASQVAALSKQIQNITKQLKDLSGNADLTDKQKAEMQQMYESQITMLEAQIAQLQQKQAEQAEQKSDSSSQTGEIKADGVNRPTDANQLNVYI